MSADTAIAEYCSRIFQIRKTVWTMLQDRGFEVKEDDKNETMPAFKRNCTENGLVSDPGKLIMRGHRPGEPRKRCLVIFSGRQDKFATDNVKFFFSQVDEEWRKHKLSEAESVDVGALTSILVIHKSMTSFAKKFLVAEHAKRNQGAAEGLPRMRLDLNVFFEVELVLNITHHEMVPKHRLMTPVEKRKLLSKYKVTQEQLPRIMLTDPVAKYLGLKRGDVVEVIRESETAGRYTTYRVCM
mmetsp:Transcript_18572/g.44642  ORF Transcript_18572/g.44642 Transcript_18572/m.44642 type:complete len:241 (+) Transcript_18572:165-887(+)|eukprot:CAMPEP_0177713396 /NCGR_PEP_ID=MMETSP0484_2-20121128/12915_1 /TAXON_ID=354590 /ORGANISM="Rhodomonas lens, Strain RHODO" /LENGTH=240 /DNA_ID=CAMNT_0019225279 /DNA_START=162 /DNA_END=884 /DNA_ORIENTATION=-